MKKQLLLFFSLFLFIASSTFAQFRKVPAEVTEAFKIKFPAATEVSWNDKITAFQASFVQNNEKLEADFSSKGIWKKTTKGLDVDDLPEAIADGFETSKYHAEWTVKSAIETQKENLTYEYRLLIEKSALQKKYLYFDVEGKLLREAFTL